MDQRLYIALIIGVLIFGLYLVNMILNIISKINIRNIVVVGLLVFGAFIYFQYQGGDLDPNGGSLTAAVLGKVDSLIPEYIDSGLTCTELEEKESQGIITTSQVCENICKDNKTLGDKCQDDRFMCKCW